MIDRSDLGIVADIALDYLETTSVDGRTFVSIEDLLEVVHENIEAVLIVMNGHVSNPDLPAHLLEIALQRAEGMSAILAQFDTILHAAEDKEGLESLSPGDFQ
jgi:hypothetical protein